MTDTTINNDDSELGATVSDSLDSAVNDSLDSTIQSSMITWDESGQPLSTKFSDVYFSPKNGLEESAYVFLKHNQLSQRFNQLADYGSFVVAETGFGTGLNFLNCWQHWQTHAPTNAQLTFISVEKYPLLPDELKRSLALWPSLSTLATVLCRRYEMHFTSIHAPQYKVLTFGNVRLLLLIDDAESGLKRLLHPCETTEPRGFSEAATPIKPLWNQVDAWFLDGFTPSRNPEMWTQSLYNTMAQLSNKATSFSTFTAASAVRRELKEAGFDVSKAPGFGTKREMLYGTFNPSRYNANLPDKLLLVHGKTVKPQVVDSNKLNAEALRSSALKTTAKTQKRNPSTKNTTPWAAVKNMMAYTPNQSVAVIGAGLAGCHTANALAKRGFNVTLIDRENTIASKASGNPQGVVYAKLSAHAQTLTNFNLDALLYAQQFYQSYWIKADHGDCCGVLQLSYNERTKKGHQAIHKKLHLAQAIKFIDPQEASTIANIDIHHSALYFPYCGWLNPKALCQSLCDHENITVIKNTLVHSLKQTQGTRSWLLAGETTNKESPCDQTQISSWSDSFDQVVITNANDASQFEQTRWVPTKPIRGQISYLKSRPPFTQLRCVICAEGYIPPATAMSVNGDQIHTHALGASFNLHVESEALNEEDDLSNLANVTQYFTKALSSNASGRQPVDTPKEYLNDITGGRVGFRCTSPDYLPLVGPAPIYDDFKQTYKALSHDAKTFVPAQGNYFSGLHINIAHGSRGLAYTPLAAELLASNMSQQPLPMSQEMVNALNPARFIIRDLVRSNK